jgi:hypothetical protein
VFENRVLRRIFGPERDGVTGGMIKLHNQELHNLSLRITRFLDFVTPSSEPFRMY